MGLQIRSRGLTIRWVREWDGNRKVGGNKDGITSAQEGTTLPELISEGTTELVHSPSEKCRH